jgi:hypothetical protein
MRKIITTILILALVLILAGCSDDNANVEIIEFGGLNWQVLDTQDEKILVISRNILEIHPYHHKPLAITWEESDIRAYLNSEFLNRFSVEERERIYETHVINNDNPEPIAEYLDAASGGNDTVDYIFLLSIEEAQTYFESNTDRIAVYANGNPRWWWLRSPGWFVDGAATVSHYGDVKISGNRVDANLLGVRPAMWIEVE